ncbi:hypothetical protein OPU71_12905 [Niveibacterium sp. 24ML]|uniref:hypothetical protein n=1 Tax=Niveibacterium sp. 24ML TaxID=2985512 RepID=UPI002270AB97|nr:hypothetical protein [Niveibacterium sp. 24ML]MCX9157024.1 hypothetical protein [Niveibacterium sp. 24ML]
MSYPARTPATRAQLVARSNRLLIWAVVLAAPSVALGLKVGAVWASVAQLAGASFMLAATLFGLALIVLPLGCMVCLISALFMRVESLLRPPYDTHPTLADKLCVAGAVLASLLPAAWPASKVARALTTGQITIRQPIEHSFSASSDALAYWENIGYWTLAAIALAGLAAYFWRSRWRIHQANQSSPRETPASAR